MADGNVEIDVDLNSRNVDSQAKSLGSKLKSGVGRAAGATVKTVAAVGTAATAALGTVGTMAVKSYSDYEQLTGGIETLFKKSYDQVMKYANNAYKTAGMSANQYMETATSFSASLLQGLKGDTEKAAKYADKAITDMSDNANKMGTDISLIQNAYQGFAKQNYTMLDNLKLGYGGTAAEMARLVNDSGVMGNKFKATAKNLNEVSFDKMIEAIHIVQTKLDITGTTAKEASSTIEGSVNSMKAAWQNLLTGMADEDQNFDDLFDKFVDSAHTVIKNLEPVIAQAANSCVKLISGILDEVAVMIPKIAEKLPSMVQPLISSFGNLGLELVGALLGDQVEQGLRKLAGEFEKQIPAIVKQGSVGLETLRRNFSNLVDAIVKVASVALPPLVSAFSILMNNLEIVIPLVTGLLTGIRAYAVISSIATVVQTFNKAVIASEGALNLATIAQYALNTAMKVNPIALVTTALIALTTAAVAYNFTSRSATAETQSIMDKTAELNGKLEESKKQWDDLISSYNQLSESSNSRITNIDLEMEKTESLWSELQKITDENGNIKKGYEDRAAFIIGELSSALGTEISIVDGQIENYQNLETNIQKVIATKRLESTLDAKSDQYNEAKAKEVDLSAELAEKENTEKVAKENLKKANDNLTKAKNEYNKVSKEDVSKMQTDQIRGHKRRLDELKAALDSAKKAQQEANTTHKNASKDLSKASAAYDSVETTITNYDRALKTVGKSAKKMNKASENLATGFKRYGDVSNDSLKKQADSAVENFNKVKNAYDDGDTHITKKQVRTAEKQAKKALKEYKKCGENTVAGYVKGINDKKSDLSRAVRKMVNEALGAGKKAAKIHSPSKITMQHGKFLADGYAEGFIKNDPAKRITQTFRHSMRAINDAMSNQVITNTMKIDCLDSLGNTIVHSLRNAGLTVSIDGRQFGRIVKDVTR